MKSILFLALIVSTLSAQAMLPVSLDIMRELKNSYRTGQVNEYISLVMKNQKISEEDSIKADEEIRMFFESDQFVETGAQYLTSLFTEREQNDILMVLRDSSLRNDPNFAGAAKLDQLMNRLKPYIVKYLRHTTSR